MVEQQTCDCVKGGLEGVLGYILLVGRLQVELVGLPIPLHLERYTIVCAEVQIHPLLTAPDINMMLLSCSEPQSARLLSKQPFRDLDPEYAPAVQAL